MPLERLRGFHPGWYGAVMGTAIVGIVAYQNPGGIAALADASRALGVVAVAVAAVLAVVLGIPYVVRWARHPAEARADFASPATGGLYGTFPGGLLVLALGIATVGPSLGAPDAVFAVVAVLAVVGIVLAFLVSVAYTSQLFLHPGVEPPAVNGAWFIPPVVTVIVPVVLAVLAPRVAASEVPGLAALGYAFWGMGIVLFVLVLAMLYSRLVLHPLPVAPLAPSIWIALGPVGVGAVALLRLAAMAAPAWGAAAPVVSAVSLLAATALWGLGIWWLFAAAALLVAYLRRGPLPYGVGWWGFTFPLGAFTTATIGLARGWHAGWLETLGAALAVGLLAVWLVVAARTLAAVRSGHAWAR